MFYKVQQVVTEPKIVQLVHEPSKHLLMSVRLCSCKDGGSQNARFLPKNQPAQRFFLHNPTMNYGSSSKSAEIVLSKSIFYVKINGIFSKKKDSLKNINLGDHFCKKYIFLSNFNF